LDRVRLVFVRGRGGLSESSELGSALTFATQARTSVWLVAMMIRICATPARLNRTIRKSPRLQRLIAALTQEASG
jgi:hypothetical protein